MRGLNSSYARYYNARYKRKGYLFQDRYRSIASQDQNYIEELVRYIHLNPFRAGVCRTMEELEQYPWCGHAVLMGKQHNTFQNIEDVLYRFDKSIESARSKYRLFLKQGIQTSEAEDLLETIRKSNEGKTDIYHTGSWVIGDDDFVRDVLAKDKENRLRITKYAKEGICMDNVLHKVAEMYEIPMELIKRRSRGGLASEARKSFIYASHKIFGFQVIEIARYLGISGPAASISLIGGEELMEKREDISLFLNLRP